MDRRIPFRGVRVRYFPLAYRTAAADTLLDSQGGAEKGEKRADTSKESV
ncbi:MAG: hypothetical protein LBF78_07125 [Treponema sp.]|jgi:hypothetical protein|nr:hypothetical protein [Treponema sp.]